MEYNKYELNKLNIKFHNTGNIEDENSIQTIEQYIIKLLNATIKKVDIKFLHIKVSINSDNFIFKHMEII